MDLVHVLFGFFLHGVWGPISTVAKPSLQCFLNVTDQVSHTHLW